MSYRSHAFLTLLAHAGNEGTRRGYFDPDAPNGRPMDLRSSMLFDAPLGSIPIRVSINDWRFDEMQIVAAAWPAPDADCWIDIGGARQRAGQVVASGRLVRGGQLRLSNPLDPVIFIQRARVPDMRALPAHDAASDPLGLYPQYLSYDVAA